MRRDTGQMRVIAGELKGRKLIAPRGEGTRPTSDKVKEAIFSMVQEEIEGAVCLDLFAGSGALGIEALSRGAEKVYFCDFSPESAAALRQNLENCRIDAKRGTVHVCDWRSILTQIKPKCNIVFIDAPYEMWEHYAQILKTLAEKNVMENGAIVVVERASGAERYVVPEGYVTIREKKYGGTGVDLLVFGGADEV